MNTLIPNLPDYIEVTGTERYGYLTFNESLEIPTGDSWVDLKIKGQQKMIYENDETIGTGWMANEDAELEIDFIHDLIIWDKDDHEVVIDGHTQTLLLKKILGLILIKE